MIESDCGEEKLIEIEKAVKIAPKGFYLEVGTRRGGSAARIMQNMPEGSVFISVDPYGAKPFQEMNGQITQPFGDLMYLNVVKDLAEFSIQNAYNFTQYKLTSLDFLQSEAMFWNNGEGIRFKDIKWSFVFLDGDHTDPVVNKEVEILSERMVHGGLIMVDNSDWISPSTFENWVHPRYDQAYKIF